MGQQPPPKKPLNWILTHPYWTGISGIVAIIAVIVTVIGLVLSHNNQVAQPSATPGTSPVIAATQSSIVSQQSSSPTTTPHAPTTVPTVDLHAPNPYGGTLLFRASMTQSTSQFPLNGTGGCSFSTDGYHVQPASSDTPFYTCGDDMNMFTNFALQVNVTLTKNSAGGIVFRFTHSGNSSGYSFFIDPSGKYHIMRTDNGTGLELKGHPTESNPIASGRGQSYLLAVVAKGSLFTFYVDGVKIDSLQDSTYSTGLVGFMVTNADDYSGNTTEAIFSDATMWQL